MLQINENKSSREEFVQMFFQRIRIHRNLRTLTISIEETTRLLVTVIKKHAVLHVSQIQFSCVQRVFRSC